jgi:HEPN domain-containing protein
MNTQEGLRWIDSGQNDFAVAKSLFADKHYSATAFFAQQSAEKALKGLLRLHGHVSWGHNCYDLLKQIEKLFSNVVNPTIIMSAQRLDDHYIPSRYPDAFSSGTPADHYNESIAQQALEDGEAVLKFVEENKP